VLVGNGTGAGAALGAEGAAGDGLLPHAAVEISATRAATTERGGVVNWLIIV
jgi:hypothetical protein